MKKPRVVSALVTVADLKRRRLTAQQRAARARQVKAWRKAAQK